MGGIILLDHLRRAQCGLTMLWCPTINFIIEVFPWSDACLLAHFVGRPSCNDVVFAVHRSLLGYQPSHKTWLPFAFMHHASQINTNFPRICATHDAALGL